MSKRISKHRKHVNYRLKKRFNITSDKHNLCDEITSIIKNEKSIFVEYQKSEHSKNERELHMIMFHGHLMYVVYERKIETPITVMDLKLKIFRVFNDEYKKLVTA